MTDPDASAIYAVKRDEDVTSRYGQEPHRSLEESKRRVDDRLPKKGPMNSAFWVFYTGEAKAVGSCCFWNIDFASSSAELGYELHKDHWGDGIMVEAMRPIVTY